MVSVIWDEWNVCCVVQSLLVAPLCWGMSGVCDVWQCYV